MTVLSYSLQRNYTSTAGHKFSWLNSIYTPLSGNIFIKHGLQRSLEAICLISQGPRVLHKQLTQSKTVPAAPTAEPPFQLQLQQLPQWWRWCGALVDSEPAYVGPAQCLPPSACRRGNSRGTSALSQMPRITYSDALRKPAVVLLKVSAAAYVSILEYWPGWLKYSLWLRLAGLSTLLRALMLMFCTKTDEIFPQILV